MNWREQINHELQTAHAARARGNEGMARVCARRAAGWTVKAYLEKRGVDLDTNSVIEHFRHMLNSGETPPECRPILEHMLQAKIKDDLEKNSYWPLEVDLVAEAEQLVRILFQENQQKRAA